MQQMITLASTENNAIFQALGDVESISTIIMTKPIHLNWQIGFKELV